MRSAIIASMPADLRDGVDRVAAAEGVLRSDIVQKSIRDCLFVRQFRYLRDRMMPNAARQGVDTGKDASRPRLMKTTLDVDVLVVAFITRGICHEMREHSVAHQEVVVSPQTADQFQEAVTRRFDCLAGRVGQAGIAHPAHGGAIRPDHRAARRGCCRGGVP